MAGSGAVRPGHSAAPEQPGGTELQRLAAVHGTITQNAVNHELKVALGTGKPGATVLGTYGTDPAVSRAGALHAAPGPGRHRVHRPVRAGVACQAGRPPGPAGRRVVGAARAACRSRPRPPRRPGIAGPGSGAKAPRRQRIRRPPAGAESPPTGRSRSSSRRPRPRRRPRRRRRHRSPRQRHSTR